MGRIFKFDKDVDTDQIIASQYLLFPTIDEMKSHTFESLDSDFASAVKPGDFCGVNTRLEICRRSFCNRIK